MRTFDETRIEYLVMNWMNLISESIDFWFKQRRNVIPYDNIVAFDHNATKRNKSLYRRCTYGEQQ